MIDQRAVSLISAYDSINPNAKPNQYVESAEVEPMPVKNFSVLWGWGLAFVFSLGSWYGIFRAAHAVFMAVTR